MIILIFVTALKKGKQGPIGLTGDKGDQGIVGPVGEKRLVPSYRIKKSTQISPDLCRRSWSERSAGRHSNVVLHNISTLC